MSQLFAWGGQNIGASASASVLPMNIQGWFPLGLTGLISLQSKGLKSLLEHHSSKASFLQWSAFFIVQLSHPYTTTGKNNFDYMDLCWQSNVFFFNMLPRFAIAFLLRSKPPLISWLQSPSTVVLEPKTVKSVTVSYLQILNGLWSPNDSEGARHCKL